MAGSLLKLPPLPPSLKGIAYFIKVATEHENRDPVISYWTRLNALQNGMKLDRKSKESLGVLMPLMDWLEKEKSVLKENEAVTNEVVASAHIENYAIKLFSYADREDRAANFNKNVVKAFYTAGILFDTLEVFGELTPENKHMRKYSKWKAAYIHNCLKNGQTPTPGPAANQEFDDAEEEDEEDPSLRPTIPPSNDDGGATAATSQLPPIHHQPPPPAAVPPPMQPPPSTPRDIVDPAVTTKAQKYCKYASSALDYDDKNTAIDNLTKALNLLTQGHE